MSPDLFVIDGWTYFVVSLQLIVFCWWFSRKPRTEIDTDDPKDTGIPSATETPFAAADPPSTQPNPLATAQKWTLSLPPPARMSPDPVNLSPLSRVPKRHPELLSSKPKPVVATQKWVLSLPPPARVSLSKPDPTHRCSPLQSPLPGDLCLLSSVAPPTVVSSVTGPVDSKPTPSAAPVDDLCSLSPEPKQANLCPLSSEHVLENPQPTVTTAQPDPGPRMVPRFRRPLKIAPHWNASWTRLAKKQAKSVDSLDHPIPPGEPLPSADEATVQVMNDQSHLTARPVDFSHSLTKRIDDAPPPPEHSQSSSLDLEPMQLPAVDTETLDKHADAVTSATESPMPTGAPESLSSELEQAEDVAADAFTTLTLAHSRTGLADLVTRPSFKKTIADQTMATGLQPPRLLHDRGKQRC